MQNSQAGPGQDHRGPKLSIAPITTRSTSPTLHLSPFNPASPGWSFPNSTKSSWDITKAYNPTPPLPQACPPATTIIPETAFSDAPNKERQGYAEISSLDEDFYCSTWFGRHFTGLKKRWQRRNGHKKRGPEPRHEDFESSLFTTTPDPLRRSCGWDSFSTGMYPISVCRLSMDGTNMDGREKWI